MSQKNLKCWNCNKYSDINSIFCVYCQKIQKPNERNIYEIFGLVPEYVINRREIEQKYFSLQRRIHPDNFMNSNENEKLFAEMHTAMINDAFKKINDSVSRANELLKILGFDINFENSTFKDTKTLHEIMFLQEELEEIRNEKEKEILQNKVENLVNDDMNTLIENFNSKKLDEAFRTNVRISYLKKLMNNIDSFILDRSTL